MHTALQLHREDFEVFIDQTPATREDVFPAWTPWDRLGVVVDRPFGALGANAMIQLAITAFYDIRPERRAGFPTKDIPRSDDAVYPEIYLFHVGGRHGFYGSYDFWPARKEVFLPADPRAVLDAVNDRGVTRLLVPDRTARWVEHEYKEPAAARDRIASAFAYAPDGVAQAADVQILTRKQSVQANAKQVLAGDERSGNLQSRLVKAEEVEHDPDLLRRHWTTHAAARSLEAHAHLEQARAVRAALSHDGVVVEKYRRISVDEALSSLAGTGRA